MAPTTGGKGEATMNNTATLTHAAKNNPNATLSCCHSASDGTRWPLTSLLRYTGQVLRSSAGTARPPGCGNGWRNVKASGVGP